MILNSPRVSRLINIFLRPLQATVFESLATEEYKLIMPGMYQDGDMYDDNYDQYGDLGDNQSLFPDFHYAGRQQTHNKVQIKALKNVMWNMVQHAVPQMKRMKVDDEIVNKKDEADDRVLEFSKVSEHCHNTKARETGISDKIESTISTCFITMLHLANDKNLAFDMEEDDFKIYKHISEIKEGHDDDMIDEDDISK